MLNTVLWSKNIINRTKQLIYKSILESIVLYGSEVWTMNQQHANRLTAVEIDFWRKPARKSRTERIRNTEIRRVMHAERNIMDEIEPRRLKWYENEGWKNTKGCTYMETEEEDRELRGTITFNRQ